MPGSHKTIFHFLLLYPFSLIYGIIIFIRNLLYHHHILKSKEFNTKIISVGNLTVGGTGKTPHVEYLINHLKEQYQLGVLSRGYKRKTKGFRYVQQDDHYTQTGDEPLQIKKKYPETIVAVDEKRKNGIERLEEAHADLDAIILDDAFQHRAVNPGLSILLIDYNNPVTKDYLLPYGRLREPAYQRKRANILIVTKTPEDVKPLDKRLFIKRLKPYPYQSIFFTKIKYSKSLVAIYTKEKIALSELKTENPCILLVTGIANSKPLTDKLKKYTPRFYHEKYPDHHHYNDKDLRYLEKKYNQITKKENKSPLLITTEKDALRLATHKDHPLVKKCYYLPINIKFIDNQGKNFNQLINDFLRRRKKKEILI